MKLLTILLFFFTLATTARIRRSISNDNEAGSKALDIFPVIDGHNDLPWTLLSHLQNKVSKFPFTENLTHHPVFGKDVCKQCHTDLPKLKAGKVGGQFWSAYIDCKAKDPVGEILEQIDVIKRFVRKYPTDLQYATSSDGILDAIANNKIASLIGIEGGQTIVNKLSVLRMFYEIGVRYITLTHTCNTDWADASPVDETNTPVNNITKFGERIVLEMNRLGMMVDLSHVSYGVMDRVLDIAVAPLIFSHSSSYAIHPHHRNVKDDILLKLKRNRGIIMVNFYSNFVANGIASVQNVADHVNHIVDVCGSDCVGIGGDYNGVTETPIDLEDVSKYPNLFNYLRQSDPERWSNRNLEKLAGRNLIRVFTEVEMVKRKFADLPPDETWFTTSSSIQKKARLPVVVILLIVQISLSYRNRENAELPI